MTGLIVLGAVGNCFDIVECVEAMTAAGIERPTPIGFLDDDEGKRGSVLHGLPVLGPLSAARDFDGCVFVNGIGGPRSFRAKRALLSSLGIPPERFVEPIIHPRSDISPTSEIGRGTVVMANCSVRASALIGEQVVMLPNCVVGHDARIGEMTIMAAGVVVSGSVVVGADCYLGANAVIRDSVTVAPGTLVGMGAVVARDILEPGGVWAGNPARALASTREERR